MLTIDFARQRFLDTCAQLNIPNEEVKAKIFPRFKSHPIDNFVAVDSLVIQLPPFIPPAWRVALQTENDWQKDFARDWEMYREWADSWTKTEKERLKAAGGKFLKVHRTKGASIRLRYKWAVQWLCLGKTFKEIAPPEYSVNSVQKAVYAVCEEISLRPDVK